MQNKWNDVSRRDFIKAAGGASGLAAISAVGLSTAASEVGFQQSMTDRPIEGIQFSFGDPTPNTTAQYMLSGHLEDAERNVIPNSGFAITAKREVDAYGAEHIANPNGLYAKIENSEGARFIEICYVVYYSELEEVRTNDVTGRTFFTKKTYMTEGMVPQTVDLTEPRPNGNLFVLTYSNDADLPGNGGWGTHP